MSWVDIVILAFIVLFACGGVLRGAKKSTLSLVTFLVAFTVSFFLAKVVAEAMLNIEGIKMFVVGDGPVSLYSWIYGATEQMPEPSAFINDNFYKPVLDIIGTFKDYSTAFTMQQGMALYLAFTLFSAIIGVGLFFVARLLLTIITVIVKSFIGKKKSWASRLIGFFVGGARGLAWMLAITIVFTSVGGFTFMDAFNSIEKEYETAVIGTHINSWSYAIRNALYLPDANMYARIVTLSGHAASPDDVVPTDIVGTRLNIYVSLMNLNCDGDKYKEEGEKLAVNESVREYSPADEFGKGGYETAVSAVINYNRTAAEGIWNRTLLTEEVPLDKLSSYQNIIQNGRDPIYELWNAIIVDLKNYELIIDESADLSDAEAIRRTNADLQTLHDKINAQMQLLFGKYASLSDLGTFTAPELPEAYRIG